MKSKKINYSIIEEDLIKHYKKTYSKDITKDFLSLTPRELGLDSLDAVELLLWAEEKYGIKTENSDFLDTQPLQILVDVIYEKIQNSKKA